MKVDATEKNEKSGKFRQIDDLDDEEDAEGFLANLEKGLKGEPKRNQNYRNNIDEEDSVSRIGKPKQQLERRQIREYEELVQLARKQLREYEELDHKKETRSIAKSLNQKDSASKYEEFRTQKLYQGCA